MGREINDFRSKIELTLKGLSYNSDLSKKNNIFIRITFNNKDIINVNESNESKLVEIGSNPAISSAKRGNVSLKHVSIRVPHKIYSLEKIAIFIDNNKTDKSFVYNIKHVLKGISKCAIFNSKKTKELLSENLDNKLLNEYDFVIFSPNVEPNIQKKLIKYCRKNQIISLKNADNIEKFFEGKLHYIQVNLEKRISFTQIGFFTNKESLKLVRDNIFDFIKELHNVVSKHGLSIVIASLLNEQNQREFRLFKAV